MNGQNQFVCVCVVCVTSHYICLITLNLCSLSGPVKWNVFSSPIQIRLVHLCTFSSTNISKKTNNVSAGYFNRNIFAWLMPTHTSYYKMRAQQQQKQQSTHEYVSFSHSLSAWASISYNFKFNSLLFPALNAKLSFFILAYKRNIFSKISKERQRETERVEWLEQMYIISR